MDGPVKTDENCPECGKGFLNLFRRPETFEFDLGDRTITVDAADVPIKQCSNCREEFIGPEAVRIRHEAVCRVAGVSLSPKDFPRRSD